jgi:hypothetical protein
MRTRTIVAGVAATLALTGAGMAGSAAAQAAAPQAVTCGTTLTTDGYLARDLRCAAGQGITLSGDVTLDLRGHRLIGPGASEDWTVGAGVTFAGGTQQVVNGTIQGWDRGVGRDDDLTDTTAVVRDVRVLEARIGVDAVQLAITLDRVTLERHDVGVSGFFNPEITITRSVVRDSTTGIQAGPGRLTVSGSRLTGNDTAVRCSEGICTLEGNRIAGNDTGVFGFFAGAGVTGNTFSGNGVAYEAGQLDAPTLTGNTFTRNEVGVQVGLLTNVTGRDNTFTANGSGFVAPAWAEDYRGTLTGNTFTRNGDGIDLPAAAGYSLGDNRAVRNTGWGIHAPGATDLGGNTATGNGNQPQCVGVAC